MGSKIPELAVVEVRHGHECQETVAFGVVLAADEPAGSYAVEVVDPSNGETSIIQAPYDALTIKHIVGGGRDTGADPSPSGRPGDTAGPIEAGSDATAGPAAGGPTGDTGRPRVGGRRRSR